MFNTYCSIKKKIYSQHTTTWQRSAQHCYFLYLTDRVLKGRPSFAQHREKLIFSLLVQNMFALRFNFPLPCSCGHTINFKISEDFAPKRWISASEETLSLCPQTVCTGQIALPSFLLRTFFKDSL